MPVPARPPHLLVLRPYFTSFSQHSVYGHVEALVLRSKSVDAPRRCGDFDYLHSYEDIKRPIRHADFRFVCQVDDRRAFAYATEFGYTLDVSGIMTARKLAVYEKPLKALERGMQRFEDTEGRTESLGHLLARLARVLRADGMALLDTRTADYFGENHPVRRTSLAPHYGEMIAAVDQVVLELHQVCAKQATQAAAA